MREPRGTCFLICSDVASCSHAPAGIRGCSSGSPVSAPTATATAGAARGLVSVLSGRQPAPCGGLVEPPMAVGGREDIEEYWGLVNKWVEKFCFFLISLLNF